MLAHVIRFPDLKWTHKKTSGDRLSKGIVGLDFLTRLWTREPYYKDEGKEWDTMGGNAEGDFFTYNAKDSCIVLEIHSQLMKEIKKQDRKSLDKP